MRRKRILFLGIVFLVVTCPSWLFPVAEDDLSQFLKPGKFIDSNHIKIKNKAKNLTKNAGSNEEKAKMLFEFVRDTITDCYKDTLKASEILDCKSNSCYQNSTLLVALCRAIGIPARLHLQKVTIKNFKREGKVEDMVFAHAITGIYLGGEWHLYETVGNRDKWIAWNEDEEKGNEMPIEFFPDKDCLFTPNKKILIETVHEHFPDWTDEMVKAIIKIDSGKFLDLDHFKKEYKEILG